MRHAHIGIFVGLVLGVVAAGSGRDLAAGEQAASVGGGGYLIRNAALVLTMDPHLGDGGILGQLEDADVLIIGDRITAVGDLGHPLAEVQVIDGRGLIVMPGFVDTHDHLWQSIIRGCAADGDLFVWLGRCVRPLRTPLFSESDAYAAVRLSTTGLINTGVTTVVDWSHAFNPDFVRGNLRALNDSGLRYAFAMIGTAADGSDIKAAKAAFIDPNPLGMLQVAATPRPGAVSGNTAVATAVAKELGVKLHFHLNEHPDERLDDPFGILEAAGAFDLGRDLHAAHAIDMTDAEIAQLAALGASVSHQPLSNMRLASGIMRYPDFQSAGIRLSLGLDGGTNDTIDAFNNMRAAVGLQRAKVVDAHASPTVPEVLRAATLGGAEALDIERRIGSLTPGKQADVIVIDPRTLNFAPVLRRENQLVFNGQPQNVTWVFVAGRALKEDGKVTGVDERELIEAAQTAIAHIVPLLQP
jgi:5-methylthioadenosine/S-adenosylhomocysteine deaminase